MYRSSPTHSPNLPHSPALHRLSSRPSSRRCSLLSFGTRARIHPVLLIPVFLFGALFSPFASSPELPEPVYRPQDYQWSAKDVFAEPDAPPLVKERVGEDYDAGRGAGRRNGMSEEERVLARAKHGEGADDWEWWDPYTALDADASSIPTSLYLTHAGLLYYPTSPSLIPALDPAPAFPAAKPYVPPRGSRPRQIDEGLTLPLPAPEDWLAPGDIFKAFSVRANALGRAQNPADLHAPLPPAPPRGLHPQGARREALQARERPQNQPGNNRQAAQRDGKDRKLGANAAAMQRALKEGRPFVPGKPAELVEAEKAHEKQLEEVRKAEQDKKVKEVTWEQVADVKQEEDEDEDEVLALQEDEEEADDELMDEEDEDVSALDAYEPGADADLDDSAILDAIRALTPEERQFLTPDEQDLIAEIESRAQGRNARAPRKDFRNRGTKMVKKEAPRAPPPKPVFNPLQAAPQRGERRGLKKRALVEDVAGEEVMTTSEPADVDVPNSASTPSSSDSESATSIARRALIEDLDSPSLSTSDSSSTPASTTPTDRLHPIAHLISRAEDEWEQMLRRQSQTLEQAVQEYERRYGMKPPVGFDSWWRYAMQNRVVLVDEYDQIHDDLLPFRSLSPSELRRRASSLQKDASLPWHKHTFGLRVKSGVVSKVSGAGGGEGGARGEDLMDLLGEFSEMLPDLDLRFAGGDEAMVVISGEARERHEEYARDGRFLGESASYEVLEPTGYSPWDSLCRPNSTARRAAQALPTAAPSAGPNLRSFVSIEHSAAVDLCEHPELRELNGVTSWSGPRPYLLYPIFSFAKTSVHADLLVPSISNDFYTEVGRDPTWEQKKHNRVLWRGENTGAWHAKGSGWKNTQRARLVALANSREGISLVHFADPASDDALRLASAATSSLTAHYLDIAYSGRPIQCSAKDKTCANLQWDPSLRWEKEMPPEEENGYKYVVDVDANYQSGRFKRLMSSRSLVFKSTIFPEWWSRRIMPWYHYIPIKSDYSDLLDVAAFFIGAPDGTGAHDQLAKRLAANGKTWADTHWREADMAAYMFRLYLEYARLIGRDEKNPHSMDYVA
ncbi:hypothetical protein JCM21900_001101 [Sporobolomyces salmonicolor]